MRYLWMALGGAAGTLLRYGVTAAMMSVFTYRYPLGTLLVNLTGSMAIGLCWGWSSANPFSANMTAFIFIGLLGGYTTFSTFSLENLQLLRDGEIRMALIYAVSSCIGGIMAAYAGLRLSGNYLQG